MARRSCPPPTCANSRRTGGVSLTCVLSPSVVDGLQQVGCVDAYEGREPVRQPPLAQHPAVAKVTAEPISLWLTRQYMHTPDVRLGHSPGISALTRDDGEREVQGWHTDFPYLWGTGDRVPLPSGDLVLGMQRNVCVSDFRKDNGATLFKLGSHASNSPPPKEWGISTQTYRKGYRAKHGLPYSGPNADVIEAPAGTIVLYDARTWHRAGMNSTDRKRGAMIQAMIPGFIVPFMDTSATLKAFLKSDAHAQVTERERKELDKLMIHKIMGPAGMFAITIDEELTARGPGAGGVRQRRSTEIEALTIVGDHAWLLDRTDVGSVLFNQRTEVPAMMKLLKRALAHTRPFVLHDDGPGLARVVGSRTVADGFRPFGSSLHQ